MNKQQAIELLGGTVSATAKAIGIEYQAVVKWPDQLSPKVKDRVIAALVRQGRDVPAWVIEPQHLRVCCAAVTMDQINKQKHAAALTGHGFAATEKS